MRILLSVVHVLIFFILCLKWLFFLKNMAFNNKAGLLIVCSTWIKWKVSIILTVTHCLAIMLSNSEYYINLQGIPVILLQTEEGDLYSATVLRANGVNISVLLCKMTKKIYFCYLTLDGNWCYSLIFTLIFHNHSHPLFEDII